MTEELIPHTGAEGTHLVEQCQICGGDDLRSVLFMGYLPPVNHMPPIGSRLDEEASFPAEVLLCDVCGLVQLGLVVDKRILFPPHYPYRSATTRILRENFAEMAAEVVRLDGLEKEHLVVDVGSNDGTLLKAFAPHCRVHGIEPTDAALAAQQADVPTTQAYFDQDSARRVRDAEGKARVVTATNVFAHIDDVHAVVDAVDLLLDEDGLFISESHYWWSLVETVQVDTVYHEHLRYYSLAALSYLLDGHGFEVIRAKRIPTHGGSIRVTAARKGKHRVDDTVASMLKDEQALASADPDFSALRSRVRAAKMGLHRLLAEVIDDGARVYGIGAPSRASTLIHAFGLDHSLVEAVLEVPQSPKVGRRMPGTLIGVETEERLFSDDKAVALMLSWHIADELMPKLRAKGFKGRFIVPLPEPHFA